MPIFITDELGNFLVTESGYFLILDDSVVIFSATVRNNFIVLNRTGDFKVLTRTKNFIVLKRTSNFKVEGI